MTRQQLLNKLGQAWTTFKAPYTGLTDEQLLEPGVTGDWSVKDILRAIREWRELARTADSLAVNRPLDKSL